MANNQVEIDVVLNADQAEKGFDKLEAGSKAVGESFGSVGKAVSTLGGEANQALGGVGESLSGVVDGFGDLASAAKNGGASFTALAGPIGIALVAIMELIQAFKEYSSEVSGASLKIEAYRASASELTSIIEELSDAQVKLNKADIEAFRIQSQRAQALTEEGQLLNEKGAEIRAEIALQKEAIVQIEKKTKSEKVNYVQRLFFETTIAIKRREIARLEAKLSPITQKSDTLSIKGAKERAKLTEMREDKLKESPEFLKKIRELEAKISSEADRNILQATKDTVNSQRKIAEIASKQKIRELQGIEDIGEDVRSKAILAERKRLEAEIATIEKNASNKRQAEFQKRRQKAQAERARAKAMELAEARQLQAELKSIRVLELESMRIQGVSAINLAKERYNDEIALAGENANLIIIAKKRLENELAKIEQTEQEKRFNHEKQLAQQRSNFIFSTLEFDAKQIEDQTTRELALLDLRYEKEIRLNKRTQEEITELQRRQSIEREKIQNSTMDAQIVKLGEFTKQFGTGFAQATYNSLLFGESFKKSIGNVLVGLGQQASVEALMELAKGFSKLANPLTSALAPAHFKSAAIFTGAAAAAGVAGKALGGGGSSSGASASAGATSPTGTPQIASTPEREEAESTSMVFNINFGGAVIYDTKQSAEQALADRITNIQNRQRRGAPRRGAM